MQKVSLNFVNFKSFTLALSIMTQVCIKVENKI